MTTPTDDEVRALLDGTTPGKWRVQTGYSWIAQGESEQVVWDVPQSTGLVLVADTGGKNLSKHKDARLIAAAPDLARALLASRERERAARAEEREACAKVADKQAWAHGGRYFNGPELNSAAIAAAIRARVQGEKQ
jgi:hypothetical protein